MTETGSDDSVLAVREIRQDVIDWGGLAVSRRIRAIRRRDTSANGRRREERSLGTRRSVLNEVECLFGDDATIRCPIDGLYARLRLRRPNGSQRVTNTRAVVRGGRALFVLKPGCSWLLDAPDDQLDIDVALVFEVR